jgi:hypothetical protein
MPTKRTLSQQDRQRIAEELNKLPQWRDGGMVGEKSVLRAADLPENLVNSVMLTGNPVIDTPNLLAHLESFGRLTNKITHYALGALVEFLLHNTVDADGQAALLSLLHQYQLITDATYLNALQQQYAPPSITLPASSPTLQQSPPSVLTQSAGHEQTGTNNPNKDFDVFLAHNSQDKPAIETLAERLKQHGLKPWLDKEQIPPGRWFQDVIQQAITEVKCAAIFVGTAGLGKWQALEIRSFISQCVTNDIPVIPVLLPGVQKLPDHLLFLQELNWVAFKTLDDGGAFNNLIWGITGKRP